MKKNVIILQCQDCPYFGTKTSRKGGNFIKTFKCRYPETDIDLSYSEISGDD